MNWLSQLHWREPLWLLLILLPLLVLAWRKRSGGNNKLHTFADPPLLRWLLSGATQRPLRSYTLIAAWILAALAAAGPYWQPKDAERSEQRGADIAVIVDISPSMAAGDITPTRLGRAKRELHDFTTMLGGDRLALVAFSANAYSMLPLTTDHDAFLRFVDLLDPTLTELPGSNLARAVEVAQGLLSASAEDSRAIVLLSDGEYHDPDTLAAARHLNADHIPLFVIGVGTPGGAPVPNADGHFMQFQGQVVISHLDHRGLQTLARAGQGAYFDLSDDDTEWRAVLTQLRDRTRAAAHSVGLASLQGIALYPWLLAISLLLFLWSGARRREGIAMLLFPLLLIHPSPGEAAPWTEQRAYEALQQGDYDQAQRLYSDVSTYSGQLGLGAAAYHRQDWQTALTAFKRATARAGDDEQQARALYNTGNALAQLHLFERASSAYRKALLLQPNLAQAALNLSLVNQFLDAHRGEQQRKDSKQLALPNVGAAPDATEQLDQQGRGDERSPQAARGTPSPDHASNPAPTGSQAGQQAGGNAPPPRDQSQQRLQQTLAQWRDSAAHGSGSPQLEAMQDNSTEFLRRRFRQDDYGPKVKIIEGKPW